MILSTLLSPYYYWGCRCRFSTQYKLKNHLLIPGGENWPIVLYRDEAYNPEEPWDGLLQGKLLVMVHPSSPLFFYMIYDLTQFDFTDLQVHFHLAVLRREGE